MPLMEVPEHRRFVTVRYLRRLVFEKRIPYYKPRGLVLIDLNELDEFIEMGRVSPL